MSKYKKYKHKLNKNFSISQNFMTSRLLLERITNISTIGKNDTVIEIGTGKGHLTYILSKKCEHLYSIEIDKRLIEIAKQRLLGIKNINLIYGDFLNYQLPKTGKYKVFANIPFSLTTKIVEKLTQAVSPPQDIWLVVEKGAAKRFMGTPSENNKSLLIKPFWETEIKYHFRRDDFHPKPSVDSVLIHFSKKDVPDIDKAETADYKTFVTHSLKYGLLSNRALLTKKQVSKALKLSNLPPLFNDSDTLYSQWICLFQCYKKFKKLRNPRR